MSRDDLRGTDPAPGLISAVILCGGAGRRLGGADKPLLPLAAKPLVEWVLERVRPQVAEVMISANRNQETYARYGDVIADHAAGYLGPLAGISAALTRCRTPWLFVCAGDVPELPPEILARFSQAVNEEVGHSALLAYGFDGARPQPLPLLCHRSLHANLNTYLAAGHRSVHGWIAQVPAISVSCGDLTGAFRSLNHPEDFKILGQAD